MGRNLLLTGILLLFASTVQAETNDLQAVRIYRDGLRAVLSYVESRPDLFPAEKQKELRILRREDKEVVWNTWKIFLDYLLALDSLSQTHRNFYRERGAAREESFLIADAAFLARYRSALEFIHRVENDRALDTLLNEPVPEIGLPAKTYSKLKFRYLHLGRASEFAAINALLQSFPADRSADAHADAKKILSLGQGRAEILTAKNALQILRQTGANAYFPVQAGVSEWMGDTKVHRQNRSLISAKQIAALAPRLEPGDILLERREWYLSNIGLPGFWPHAALYIGTPEERRDLQIEDELQSKYPDAYRRSLQLEHGHPYRLLEAISEGVSFTTLEHSADCDALAVLRPRLPNSEKAKAIVRAFHYAGRPYDFNFDFATDATLVCTELVYKSYEPATGFTGLTFPLVDMLGRKVTPANEMVRQFADQFGTPQQQTDLVIFLDGRERQQRAVEVGPQEFRDSWRRPKWHILSQE
ncbi:MAG: YiiX/YebB-like N1pC/P60 family cysteine hydrolase [Verrucomicrobiota bacterium]